LKHDGPVEYRSNVKGTILNDKIIYEDCLAQVRVIIHQVSGILTVQIQENDSLVKDLGMDSVELIDLFIRLEEYGLFIPDSMISSSLTVRQIVELMAKKV